MTGKTKIILILILLLAAILRFYEIDRHDVINDEVFYGYRSIGLIDTLNSPQQTTPFEWFEETPLWAKLSFHDHPPLGFWIQHLFFSVFGNNLFALRLPFALAGIASVFLVFLIARRLFESHAYRQAGDRVGLAAAGLLAVSSYHTWVSRVGLQESLVIFFILLSIYLFVRALAEERYFYWMILAAGLAILTKYTAIILLPLFLTFLLWKRRDLLTKKRIGLSAVILIPILLPVIIYNLMLFKTRGHFDFQISYFLGQNVADWQIRPGREVGGFPDRVKDLFTNYWNNAGIIFSVLTLAGLVGAWFRRKESGVQLLVLASLFLILLLLVIGPQERFLAMLTPFLAMLTAAVLSMIIKQKKHFIAVLIPILLFETAFNVNSLLLTKPIGKEGAHYSLLRRDHRSWGYNELEKYLEEKTAETYPAGGFPLNFEYARELRQEALEKAKADGKNPYQLLIVSDSTMSGFAALWHLNRHIIYDTWLVLDDFQYLRGVSQDENFFREQGFEEIIFVKAADTLRRGDKDSRPGEIVEEHMAAEVNPVVIKSASGAEAFRVYDVKL